MSHQSSVNKRRFAIFLVVAIIFEFTNIGPVFFENLGLEQLASNIKVEEVHAAGNTVVVITSTASTTWTVPADFATGTIEVIGGGGGGATGAVGTSGGGAHGGAGGGGGAGGTYAKASNVSLTPNSTITIQVGSGGGVSATGTDTWFNSSTCAAASACGKGGGAGSGTTGGNAQSGSIGTAKAGASGGAGGATPSGTGGAGGGGGGGAGGLNSTGVVGTNGSSTSGNTGGSGGPGGQGDGTNGGAGGTINGGNATGGTEWSTSPQYGSGGGAGGGQGGASTGNGSPAGTSGSYGAGGGGGGGSGKNNSGGTGGSGTQGIIVITYTPVAPSSAPGTPTYNNVSTSTLTVNWTAATSSTQYNVARSTDGNTFSVIATTTALTYGDSNLSNNTTYYYKVRGEDSANDMGPYSASSSVTTTRPPSITSIAYTVDGDGGRSGDSIVLTGTGFGAATAGSRASCSGAGVSTGCIKFIVGGNDTVADASISAWSNTSITFTVSSTLATLGGAGALQVFTSSTAGNTNTFYVYPNVTSMSTCTNCNANAARENTSTDTDGLIMLNGDHFGQATGTVYFTGNFNNASATIHATTGGACTTAGWAGGPGSAGSSTPAFVQGNIINNQLTRNLTSTFPSNTTAGNLLIITALYASSNGGSFSISDTQGDSFVTIPNTPNTANDTFQAWYAQNIVGGADIISVTTTFSTADHMTLAIHEYSGIAATSSFSTSTVTTAVTSASPNTSNVSAVSNQLLFAMEQNTGVATVTSTAGAGYTMRESFTSAKDNLSTEDKIATSSASYNATMSLSVSDTWNMLLATFNAGSASGGGASSTNNTVCVEVPPSIGDRTYTGSVSLVRAADSPGKVGTWANATALPKSLQEHSSVVNNGYIYTIGGYDGTVVTSTVFYAPINTTGSIGAWSTTTALPSALKDHSAVVYNGYIYTTGGCGQSGLCSSTALATTTVFYAPINSTGSLGSWLSANSLPGPRESHSVVVANDYIYVMGGDDGPGGVGTIFSTVFYAPINTTGSIGAWSTTTALPSALEGHSAAVYNGYIYATGGCTTDLSLPCAAAGTSTVFYAPINTTGSISAWSKTTALPSALQIHSLFVNNGYIYTTGGYGGTGVTSTVFYAPINTTGSIGAWSTTTALPSALDFHSVAVNNGFVYTTGGSPTSTVATSTVFYASLNSKSDPISFTVLPRITSETPSTASSGVVIDIVGNHFCENTATGCPVSPNRAASTDNVLFGNTTSTDSDFQNLTGGGGTCNGTGAAWTHSEICVKVPAGTPAGSASTTITSNTSYQSNAFPFTVTSTPSAAPNNATNTNQFQGDGSTQINVGSSTATTTVVLKADASSTTAINMALQIEATSTANSFGCTNSSPRSCAYAIEGTVSGGGACTSCTSLAAAKVSSTLPSVGDTGSGYHWQARLVNTTTNETSSWISFPQNPTNTESVADFNLDVNAPTISSLATSSVSTSTATITWNTSGEKSTSQVQYGTSSIFAASCGTNNDCTALADPVATSSPGAGGVNSHTVNLTGLATGTIYYFRARSKDDVANESISATSTFTTSSGGSAIAFVQSTSTMATSVSTLTVTLTTSQNDALVVAGKWGDQNNVASISDNKGNTYATSTGPTLYGSSNTKRAEVWTTVLTGASSYGSNHQITITLATTSVSGVYLFVHEYSGTDTTNPVDVATSTKSTGTAQSSGNVTTTVANDMIYGADFYDTSITSAGSGFTQRIATGGHMTEDKLGTSTQAYAATFTGDNGASTGAALVVALKPSSGLPVTGQVNSSVFDTGATNGAAYNSIMWEGTAGTGKVRFQLATSNSTSGPWTFIGGPTCTGSDYYDPGAVDTPVELTCAPQNHNNQRYFKYLVQICSNSDCSTAGTTSPTVTGVVVNWSP